jgi:hypothetical protein
VAQRVLYEIEEDEKRKVRKNGDDHASCCGVGHWPLEITRRSDAGGYCTVYRSNEQHCPALRWSYSQDVLKSECTDCKDLRLVKKPAKRVKFKKLNILPTEKDTLCSKIA